MKHFNQHLWLSSPTNLRQLSSLIVADQHPTTSPTAMLVSHQLLFFTWSLTTIFGYRFSQKCFWPTLNHRFFTIVTSQTVDDRFLSTTTRKILTTIKCQRWTSCHCSLAIVCCWPSLQEIGGSRHIKRRQKREHRDGHLFSTLICIRWDTAKILF